MNKELNHPPINFGKTGALIINLGTPDSTSWFDIRRYLKEFLSDKRVCLLYTSPSPRDMRRSRMPSSA